MNSADFAVALLSERDCSECMRCNGRWIPEGYLSLMDFEKFNERGWICKIGFKKFETRNICNKFVDKRKVWSRVIFNLKYIIASLLVFDIIKYVFISKFSISFLIGDIVAIFINIVISYFLNKRYVKKQEE